LPDGFTVTRATGGGRSLREVAAELAKTGHVLRNVHPLSAGVVQRLLKTKASVAE